MKIVRMLRSYRIAGACLVLALLILWSIGSGCGIIFAPITVPAAIGENHNEGAMGIIVDEAGQPLQQVKLHIDGPHDWWDPIMGVVTKDEQSDKVVDGKFGFFRRASYAVTVTFRKEGYHPRVYAFMQGAIYTESAGATAGQDTMNIDSDGRTIRLSRDPTLKPDHLRVVMQKIGPTVKLESYSGTLSDAPRHSAVLLGNPGSPQGTIELPNPPSQPPQDCLSIIAKRDAQGNVAITQNADPCGCRMIEELRVRLTSAGGGLLRYIPHTIYPFREMREAPDSGYQQEIVLTASDIHAMPEKKAYFYFLANGKYGKACIQIQPLDITDGKAQQVEATVEVRVAAAGGRNLNDGE